MRLYLLVNPIGGGGKGRRILERVMPVFQRAGTHIDIIETNHATHAQELAGTLPLQGYDGLCAIGGDGTLGHIVDGMLTRVDGQKIPLGFIPGGSGNSYMKDIGVLDPQVAAQAITRGNPQKMDAIRVCFSRDQQIMYVPNMIGWGLAADIGIQAERRRWLGRHSRVC